MKLIFKFLLAVWPVLFAKNSLAQGNAVKTPAPIHQILKWEGYWEAQVTLQLGDKMSKAIYYADFRKTADGNGMLMYEWCDIPGVGKFNGANLIGFDPYDGKIHWYSVDNLGTTHEHIGEFSDEKTFYMEHRSQREGKEYVEKINLEWKDKNALYVKLTGTLDGKQEEAIEGTFIRKPRRQ